MRGLIFLLCIALSSLLRCDMPHHGVCDGDCINIETVAEMTRMLHRDASAAAVREGEIEEILWRPSMTDLDFNDDGVINQTDLDMLKSHFNERYTCFVPWDLNADLRCDHRDFYYFAARVPLDYRFRVASEIQVWNLTDFTIDTKRRGAYILDEYIPPRDATRVLTWLRHCTSIEPPKDGDVVCVHYTRDLCKAAFKELGPKSIAWASSGVHAYGIIYTGGDWRDLSNWFIMDPLWHFYGEATNISSAVHETHRIEMLLDEGRFGYWSIHFDVDFKRGIVFNPYKAEFRIGNYRERCIPPRMRLLDVVA